MVLCIRVKELWYHVVWDSVLLIKYTQATWESKAVYGGLGKLSTGQGCPSRFQSSTQDAASVIVTYKPAQQKEPLVCHEIPTRPWQSISADLFERNGTDYLVTTDRYSNFFQLDVLGSNTSKEISNKLKPHFARYGLPDTDNGPQFECAEFQSFAKDFQFEHIKTSPRYPQSNGKAKNSKDYLKESYGCWPWLTLVSDGF